MKFKRDENGQTLLLTAMCVTLIIGFVGLGVDMGLIFHAKRDLQITADAAATAAALDYHYNGSVTSAQAAGQAAATANGVTNGSGGAVVTINCPPASGPNIGDGTTCNGFAEALVKQPTHTFFMNAFGYGSVQVAARGVGGVGINSGCVYALNSTGTAIQASGSSSNITAPTCSVLDNSSLSLSGGSFINAKSVGVVGTYSFSGSSTTEPSLPTTIPTFKDPLAYLQPPAIPSPCTAVINNVSGTFSQGCYSSITVSGSNTVNFNPGLYIVNGNFKVQGSNATVIGTGVTFYVTGQVTLSGASPSTQLTAPGPDSSGQYKGVLFFQSRTDSQQFTFSGGSGGKIEGIIYVPDANLLFSGGSVGTLDTDLVVNTLTITGGSNLGNYSTINANNALANIILVE